MSSPFWPTVLIRGCAGAWEKRGHARELKTLGQLGPVEIQFTFRETITTRITYHLSIDEENGAPVVLNEWMEVEDGGEGMPFRFLDFARGKGMAIVGDDPSRKEGRIEIPLKSTDLLAMNALGQFADHPRVAAFREFIQGWHLSQLSVEYMRQEPQGDRARHLTRSSDNLAHVIKNLSTNHPDHWARLVEIIRNHIPRVDDVLTEQLPDGRLALLVKDAPFDRPMLARFASEGTLKLLAYLVMLNAPEPPSLIGLEEPENDLHPRLLPELAELCRIASERTQLLATTHSPFFLNALRPEEAWILWRDDLGHAHCNRAAELPGVRDFMENGALLGDLWMEGHFRVGDPLSNHGGPCASFTARR
jgi:predicted ATPase